MAAMIPYRNALERYGLEYRSYSSSKQEHPDRPLFELLDLIKILHRNWLYLRPSANHQMRIVGATEDIYFFHEHVIVDRVEEEDSDDSDDEEAGDTTWELEVYKYGEPPGGSDSNDLGVEIEEDGTVVEEIDPDAHGIDVNDIETDDEDEENGPENSDSEGSAENNEWAETEGLHGVAKFRTGNSFLNAYKADVSQDLVITGEQWLKGKVSVYSRLPVHQLADLPAERKPPEDWQEEGLTLCARLIFSGASLLANSSRILQASRIWDPST
jgi:hypothetical protein